MTAAFCDCNKSARQRINVWRACGRQLLLWFFATWRAEPVYGHLSPKEVPMFFHADFHVKQSWFNQTVRVYSRICSELQGRLRWRRAQCLPSRPAGRPSWTPCRLKWLMKCPCRGDGSMISFQISFHFLFWKNRIPQRCLKFSWNFPVLWIQNIGYNGFNLLSSSPARPKRLRTNSY